MPRNYRKQIPKTPRRRTIAELSRMSRVDLMKLAAQHGIKLAVPPISNGNLVTAYPRDDSDDEEGKIFNISFPNVPNSIKSVIT